MSARKRALASLNLSQDEFENKKIGNTAKKMAMDSGDYVRPSEIRWDDSIDDEGNELLLTNQTSDDSSDYLGDTKEDFQKLNDLIHAGLFQENKDQEQRDKFKNFSKELLKKRIQIRR